MVVIPTEKLHYSDKYDDGVYEYRHVIVPKEYAKQLPKQLMTEQQWRALGVAQSPGWQHYMLHKPEPHVLMFRRLLPQSAASHGHGRAKGPMAKAQAVPCMADTSRPAFR